MTFAAPGYLGVLALLPLLVYLHMRRHRYLRVPTTAIWRMVHERSEPRPRVRPVRASLALLLQIATVAFAAFALAEPRFTEPTAGHQVLIIDGGVFGGASAGSGGDTAYEAGWRAWLRTRPRGAGNVYSVWWVGPTTRPLAIRLDSLDAVRRSLELSSHADALADWRAAANILPDDIFVDADVTVLASDTDVAREATETLRRSQHLEFGRLAVPDSNLGIISASIDPTEDGETWDLAVTASVRSDGPGTAPPVTFDVRFTPRGASTSLPYDTAIVGVTRANQARYSASLTLPGAGLLEVRLVTSDGLAVDDVVRFDLDPAPPPAIVHVLSAFGDTSPAAKALEAMDRFDVSVVPELASTHPDLLVVEGVGDPFEADARPPYAVLWLGTSPDVASVSDLRAGPAGTARWDRSHPAAHGTAWSLTGSSRAFDLPGHGPEVLVEGVSGTLVSAKAWAGGREVISAFDPGDRSFVASDQFVSFIVDVVDWLVPRRSQVATCTVGETCRLPWSQVSSGIEAISDGTASWSSPPLSTELPTRLDELWTPQNAGLWVIESPGGIVTSVAVNPPLGITDSLGPTPASPEPRMGDGGPAPVLPWRGLATVLALSCLLIAVIESVVAGRGSEGFWRRPILMSPGAAGRRSRSLMGVQILAMCAALAALFAAPFPLPTPANWLVLIGGTGSDESQLPISDWGEDRLVRVSLADADGSVDIGRAVQDAIASVDPAMDLDIVVASDVSSTQGHSLRAGQTLFTRSATVHGYRSPWTPTQFDVAATDLTAPQSPFKGDVAQLTASLFASNPSQTDVRLLMAGEAVYEQTMSLDAGWTTLSVPVELNEAGTVEVALEVSAPNDPLPINDRYETVIDVRVAPVVAMFASDDESAADLADALVLQGFDVELRAPHTMGTRAEEFIGYEAVIVMDVPAVDLARTQQEALENWVRSSGGGLLLLGGERSFGPGGYLETPLDLVSPLSSKVSRDAPAVAMLFVLDRSGSMQQTVDGVTRLEIAKEATLAANDLLGEGSEIAVVVFDEEARTLLPFTSSSDLRTIEAALRSLVPGGGTSLVPGLVAASEVLETTDAAAKHVVVMTDGLSQPGDLVTAVERLVELDATVSAIAIGTGSDIERVRSIARIGGGTAHTTTDFRALPSILAQEAMLLSGDPVVRQTVVPRRTGEDVGVMAGTPQAFPPVHGFVETTAKVDATVLIEEGEGRPLLGAWRYGAGRVMSFASQAVGPWADAWSNDSDYALWWSQWLRWVVQPGAVEGLVLEAAHVGDELHVSATATGERGRPISSPSMVVSATPVLAPAAEGVASRPVATAYLRETTPGHYVGVLPIGQGEWEVSATVELDDVEYSATTLAVHSYPATYAGPPNTDPGLIGLVGLTGGNMLSPASDWSPARRLTWKLTSAWRPWLVVAISIWMLFLVMRYAPGWLAPRRLRTRPADARRPKPNRTPAMPTR